MEITEKISMNNSQNEIESEGFMENAYEQINKDISKLLNEMRKEKQKGAGKDDNLELNFFKDEDKANSIIYNNSINNKLIHNINNNFIDIKMNNYYYNNSLMSKQMKKNDNILTANNKIIKPFNNYPINIVNNNSSIYNININNKSNNENDKSYINQIVDEIGISGINNQEISDNTININNIIKNKDKRTTLIIKNIPNKYTIQLLLIELSTNFANKFDIIYLPQDKINNCNLGYGFINFVNPLHLILFYEEFMGKKWNYSNSQKRCFLAYSNYQGKKDLINYMLKKIGGKKFNNHKIMNEKIRKCFYINNNNINAPLEIPIKYQIKFENYHPFSIYYKKSDKILIVETFKK